jgi:hypothetical protein
MTDYLNRFGAVTNQGSDNVLDFEAIDPRAAMQTHRTGEQHDSTAVFFLSADYAGNITPKLIHCDTETGTFTDLVVGETKVDPKAGNFALIPMPKSHKRYVKAILTAAASGVTVEAFIQPGPSQPRQ